MKQEGSFSEGVLAVYPSVTYPAHTTIVTGRLPGEHGVYSNYSSRRAGKNPEDWYWFTKSIKVPTLWDEARRAHQTTAAVFWPVTVGAAIEWNIPEIWDPKVGPVGDPVFVAKYATPGLLFEALMALGPPPASPAGEQPPAKAGSGPQGGPMPQRADDDVTRTRLALFLLKKYKPNLLLLHLASPDEAEHQHGPGSSEAVATLERIDKRLGELEEGVKEAGLGDSTDFFIVSDHGFLPAERIVQPNVLLADAGLLTADDRGLVSGGKIATVSNGGSFFIYWEDGKDYRPQIDLALKPLLDRGVLWAILDRRALADLGAEPAVQMALEAPAGTMFGGKARGEIVSAMKPPGGSHGFLPFRKGLEASFIAWGPDIRGGINLHQIRMTAIGPTILKVMGIDDPQFGTERPLTEILK